MSAGPITTWTAMLCGRDTLLVQPILVYSRGRGNFNANGRYESFPDGDKAVHYQEQVFLQYGVTDRLELSGQMIYQQNDITVSGERARPSGFTDSYLYLRYALFGETHCRPQVTGVIQLKAPTGKYQHADPAEGGADLMGTGSWDPGLGLILSHKVRPFLLHADASYSQPHRVRVDGVLTRYADYVNYDVGLEYFLPKGLNVMLELNGLEQGDVREDGRRVEGTALRSVSMGPGLGWSNEDLQTLLSYQRTVAGKNVEASEGLYFTCLYTF
ncbi:MAG TPA: transporter [Elusimicrobiota bacterium]|nr:transporter [Elusimicrobiota bacterium]